jgi:hypothetical protein
MEIICPYTFKGQPEPFAGRTIWSFISNAERLSCIRDGDRIQVAAIVGGDEVPLAEVGLGLWRRHADLGDVLAKFAAFDARAYRERVRLFAGKLVTWLE